MRILVTGGAGFVGSHLCDRLVADGHEVVCIDNFITGFHENLRQLDGHPRFQLVEHDVQQPFSGGPYDQIYNLACPASPVHYQRDPVATLKTCILGAFNALDAAIRDGARVLQASTSEVYGDPDVHPQPEEYVGSVNCTGRRSCYDEGKRAAETAFYDYHRHFGVEIRVARIFNTYGPRMSPDDGRVIPNFITQALAGSPISVFGKGTQTRSFCYIDDMVEALVRLMNAPGGRVGPINLGNPVEFTVGTLAEIVLARTGSKAPLAYLPLPEDDPKIRQPDISKATVQLGWLPHVTLTEGLDRTIEWYTSVAGVTHIANARAFDLARSQGISAHGR